MTAATTIPLPRQELDAPPGGSADRPTCVELFGGLGGLALGLEAHFEHRLLVERDPRAVATIERNEYTRRWPLHAGDVAEVDFAELAVGGIDLLAAGVPCQPWSQAGAHAGPADERNMFPQTFAAIRALRPRAVLIENVRGLARPAFRAFLDYVVDHLRLPHLAIAPGETWRQHHRRLRAALKLRAGAADERYRVEWHPVQVADYGVPQRRTRVIIAAIREDLADAWTWPRPTHSHEALLLDQLDGHYWDEHALTRRSPVLKRHTRWRLRKLPRPLPHARWRTLRDALIGLPDPAPDPDRVEVDGHMFWPGARLYRGHRGSDLDLPSKTIKAGVHGVAGGEHIVHLDDGGFRYMTVRECARAQRLPDWLRVEGPRTAAMRQIGNAVPPPIGDVFGLAIARTLSYAAPVPRPESVNEQDVAARGRVLRIARVGDRDVTAHIRIQGDYASLYWTRSAGPPRYIGRIEGDTREERLAAAWRAAHQKHPELFPALAGDRAA